MKLHLFKILTTKLLIKQKLMAVPDLFLETVRIVANNKKKTKLVSLCKKGIWWRGTKRRLIFIQIILKNYSFGGGRKYIFSFIEGSLPHKGWMIQIVLLTSSIQMIIIFIIHKNHSRRFTKQYQENYFLD